MKPGWKLKISQGNKEMQKQTRKGNKKGNKMLHVDNKIQEYRINKETQGIKDIQGRKKKMKRYKGERKK